MSLHPSPLRFLALISALAVAIPVLCEVVCICIIIAGIAVWAALSCLSG